MPRPRTEPKTVRFTIRFAPGELERLEAETPAGELSSYLRKRALERADHAKALRGWAASLRELARYAGKNSGAAGPVTPRTRALSEVARQATELAAELESKAGAL